jgi:signal transduction histidine kinase
VEELLLAAADRAAVELARVERIAESEVRGHLSRASGLTLAVLAAQLISGAAVEQAAGEIVPSHYFDALRDAVRAEARVGAVRLDGRELMRLFDAIDSAAYAGLPHHEHGFTRHLTGTDAMNAVIEIAHDMRSPLASILFLVDTLRRGQSGPVTPVQERQLGLIYGAALGLNTLACDVIDALRGGQRLVDGPPAPFSIAEVIFGVCDTVRPISEEKSLPLKHVLPIRDARVGHSVALGRVLLNLTTNALKYTQEGSVTLGCTELTGDRVAFWVEDTGSGIPEHVMSMLFDGFRPSASGTRFSNAGLGLAICQSFLGALGSRLEVESAPARGTRFSFEIELPRA